MCRRLWGGVGMTEPAFIFSTPEIEVAHSAGQSAHPNLLANSRVIQALRRLAAARERRWKLVTRTTASKLIRPKYDAGAHAFADWTARRLRSLQQESSTSSFPMRKPPNRSRPSENRWPGSRRLGLPRRTCRPGRQHLRHIRLLPRSVKASGKDGAALPLSVFFCSTSKRQRRCSSIFRQHSQPSLMK